MPTAVITRVAMLDCSDHLRWEYSDAFFQILRDNGIEPRIAQEARQAPVIPQRLHEDVAARAAIQSEEKRASA